MKEPQTSRTLLEQLINRPSITPNDAGCMNLIAEYLKKHNFFIEIKKINDVTNFWAIHGQGAPLTVLAGHTDVVPPGNINDWDSDPFKAEERDGYLYGRGAADMKSGVATMCVAVVDFVKKNPDYKGSIAIMLTSDEEGPAQDGIKSFMPYLIEKGVKMNYAIFTEPSSVSELGDMIKNGRRGSMQCYLTVTGKQGHVAYPHNAANPIHALGHIMHKLSNTIWCKGNNDFPPTTMQIWDMKGGINASNVIPKNAKIAFNFRFSNELSSQKLINKVEDIVTKVFLELNEKSAIPFAFHLDYEVSGEPFLTPNGQLVSALSSACKKVLNKTPVLSTSGGTSDARFIAPYGIEVVEFGPINETIHQANESIKVSDIEPLKKIYVACLEKLYL